MAADVLTRVGHWKEKENNSVRYHSEPERPVVGAAAQSPSALPLTCLVVSMLLVNADLGQPGVDGQNLDFVAISKLVRPPHLAFVFSGPVHVSFEHIQAVGMADVCNGDNVLLSC